jgi:glycine/D-amino acid oxidase-like deaminating enzyme
MKIAVIGAGAMGSIYAALLADAGHEVWAVDTWGAHVDVINAKGLRVEGAQWRSDSHIGARNHPNRGCRGPVTCVSLPPKPREWVRLRKQPLRLSASMRWF